MRGGRFLSCRHGAIGVVHLVVVHGPGHGVDFSGIVCSNDMFVERFPRKEKKKFQRFFFIILGANLACTFFFFTKDDLKDFFLSSLVEKKKAHASLACAFFHGCTTSKNTSITQVLVSQL